MTTEIKKPISRDIWRAILFGSIIFNAILLFFVGLPGMIFWLIPIVALAKLYPNAGESPKVVGEYDPTDAEIKARTKRNVALAVGLASFMIFVFVTMIVRSG